MLIPSGFATERLIWPCWRWVFAPDALALIVRSTEGVLRHARNLCVASLLEAVRDRTKTVELKQVNRVLLQPHWRREEIF